MCIFLIIINIASVFSTTRPPKDIFSRLVIDYQKACPQKQNAKTACCGNCLHSYICDDADCCFDMFEDFGEALGIHSHDSWSKICLLPKLTAQVDANHLAVDTTSPVWISDHCFEESNLISVELCKNPGMNNHFSSIVPITGGGKVPHFFEGDEKHYLPFRNKFCSKCFNVKNETGQTYWGLSIKCEHKIYFNHENFLHAVKENNCDVYFKRPVFEFAPQCTYPVYSTISSCNVTGLWSEYDNAIEAACHAFVDIFNQTYRNYFCYVCNTDNPEPPELLSCERQGESDEAAYSMDLSTDLISKIKDGTVLGCDPETQFVDLKQMVCRSFHCNGFTYDENTCNRKRIKPNSYCLVVSVKLKFGTQILFHKEQLDIVQIFHAVHNEMTIQSIYDAQLKNVRVYVRKMKQSGITLVDYLIVQLFIDETVRLSRLKLLVEHLHRHPCYIGISNVFPWCEFVLYDAESAKDQELIAPVFTTPKPDVKRSLDSVPSNYCSDKKLQVINKLYFCLHVELTTKELQMKIDDNILIITINSTEDFGFSPWEYEITDEGVKLCMEDYLKIYNVMSTYIDGNRSKKNDASFNEVSFAVALVISFVYF